jgi:uncharacterized membrane protein
VSEHRSQLESLIGWVLILGVLSSVLFEVIGLALNYAQTGDLTLALSPTWHIQSANFFSFIGTTIASVASSPNAFDVLAIGIILLMLTPYVRVLVSMLYYAATKDFTYVGITLLVLIIITASLLAS